MRSRTLFTLFLLSFSLTLGAQNLPIPPSPNDHEWCGTTESRLDELERRFEWNRNRSRLAKAGVPYDLPESRIEDQIILLESGPDSMPFDHPFDLEGKSLLLTRQTDGFLIKASTLDYEDEVGELVRSFEDDGEPGWYDETIPLSQFEFPFGDALLKSIHVTAFNSIHTGTPALVTTNQLNETEALSLAGGIISPLMLTRHKKYQFDFPDVFVKESSESITITWRVAPNRFFAYDVQARLESTGDITLSYRTVRNVFWGSVLVTTGEEPFRTNRTNLYTEGTRARPDPDRTIEKMLDLRSVSVDRLGDSSLLEITLTTRAAPALEALEGDSFLNYYVEFRSFEGNVSGTLNLFLERDSWYYHTSAYGWREKSPAATIDGSVLTLRFTEADLQTWFSPTTSFTVLTFRLESEEPVDIMGGPITIDQVSTTDLGLDLSLLSESTPETGPVLESFTLPDFVPDSAWSDLKRIYGFLDDDIDAVAFFQDFHTDLMLYASAYSTVGNPAADGVSNSNSYGTSLPRSPALLHMNKVDFGLNVDLDEAVHVLGHELGHRWLYFIDIDIGGGSTNVLRPGGGHPAQYVHTPAAFRVFTDFDSSTMGGATFTDHGDGTFTAPDPVAFYGYSWHELYLMGLAHPDEVEDWWYIDNSNPPLGPAYYPPAGITVSGIRRDVDIDDIVRAMGPRFPTVETSQKRFRVLFVLMSRPGTEPSRAMIDRVEERRRELDRVFLVATGGRGSIESRMTAPPKRRGVRR